MPLLTTHANERVRALVPSPEHAGHTALAHAVLDGWLPGRVFADDVPAPSSAIICPDNGFFLAVGRPAAELVQETVATVQRDLLHRLVESRLIVATTPAWESILRPILPYRAERKEFRFVAGTTPDPAPAPGYRSEPVSVRTALLFGAGIDPWVVRSLGGPEAFAARSFGTVILAEDGTLASACVAGGVGGGEAEIEIGTTPGHRRRGLAMAAAAGFFAQASKLGLRPAWTCAAENLASVATALRLGFRFTRTVGVFPIDPRMVRHGDEWRLITGA